MEPLHKEEDVASTLRQKYTAMTESRPRGLKLRFPGILESFELLTDDDELTLSSESWHEHFPDVDSLLSFLDGLFSGRLDVVVTYRGERPVGHQIRVHRDGHSKVVSHTAVLASPFWRRKSRRTLSYARQT